MEVLLLYMAIVLAIGVIGGAMWSRISSNSISKPSEESVGYEKGYEDGFHDGYAMRRKGIAHVTGREFVESNRKSTTGAVDFVDE